MYAIDHSFHGVIVAGYDTLSSMKICVIQNVLDPFKGGNHLPLFAALKDVQFTVVCNRSKAKPEDLPANVTVVTVPGRIGPYYYGCADYLFAKQLLTAYPHQSDFWSQFDGIHLNQVMGPALRKLSHCPTPLLLLIHHPVTADREVAVQESCGLNSILWKLKYFLLVRWQKAMCASAQRIVTVSQTMGKRIAADYGCSTEQISIVPDGVDGSLFSLTTDSSCTSDVIAVGSFVHPRKGFPYLLEAYKKITASGREVSDVGRRSDEQRNALEKIEGVTVYGTVEESRLVELLQTSRVLISTSQFEGFGLSLIEALACGHPAFAFDKGAVPEVLESIDSNLVISASDTVELCRRIEEYLKLSSEVRDQKGQQYRQAVLKYYPLSQSAERLHSVYKELVL